MSYYVHHVPGRLRVKIPAVKGSSAKAGEIGTFLQSLKAVHQVETNPLTGSVVVTYDADVFQAGDILAALKARGYVQETKLVEHVSRGQRGWSDAGSALGRMIFGWAVGRALEGTGLSFLTVFI